MTRIGSRAGDVLPLLPLLVVGLLGAWLWQYGHFGQQRSHELQLRDTYGLVSAQGPLQLADLRGKVVLVYFGYTRCASACPTTLLHWRQALQQLPLAQQQQVTGLLVSLDPERDGPELLAEYTSYFHDNIVGVTAAKADLAAMAEDFHVYYRRHAMDNRGEYALDHTVSTFILDSRGQLRHVLPPQAEAGQIRARITDLLPSSHG